MPDEKVCADWQWAKCRTGPQWREDFAKRMYTPEALDAAWRRVARQWKAEGINPETGAPYT